MRSIVILGFGEHRSFHYAIEKDDLSVVGLWGNRLLPWASPGLAVNACNARLKDMAGGRRVIEPKREPTRPDSRGRQWVKFAVTLFLVIAVIVTGTAAFHSQNAWWEKYLSFIY
jgi:hypothetical protein